MSLVVPSLRGIVASAPWAKNELWRKAQAVPSLDLRFADSKSLTDAVSGQNLITFTRASSGTYVGSDGLIKTALADAPRFDHNPVTGESLGLLIEEKRVNLLLSSDSLATQSVTVTAVAHTLSFYGTGTVTLSGTHSATVVGTGAYPTRTTLTFTPTAGSLTATVSGTVQYAQLEAGAFPTSYIKNVDTPGGVTRNADVASITGGNFSSWYSQIEGTVFAEATATSSSNLDSAGTAIGVGCFSDGTSNERLRFGALGFSSVYIDGGVTQANLSSGSLVGGSEFKLVSSARVNDFAFVRNGGSVQSDTSGTLPTVSQLEIARSTPGAGVFTGTISRLTFFNRRLPNATLQTITSP